jgi:hypothetical protein
LFPQSLAGPKDVEKFTGGEVRNDHRICRSEPKGASTAKLPGAGDRFTIDEDA